MSQDIISKHADCQDVCFFLSPQIMARSFERNWQKKKTSWDSNTLLVPFSPLITLNSSHERQHIMPASPRIFIGVKRAHAFSLHQLLFSIHAALLGQQPCPHQIVEDVECPTNHFESRDQVTLFCMNTGSFSWGNENLCQPRKVQSALRGPQGQTKQH